MELNPSPYSLASRHTTERSEIHEAIRRRAEEIYIRSGRIGGRDLENWAQAEAEILQENGRSRRAIVVGVDGVQYVGEYSVEDSQGYRPGEFQLGEDMAVRLEGDKMFVRRRNGTELETTIVRKIG